MTKAWRMANELICITKYLDPSLIKHQDDLGKPELVTSHKNIATIFNTYFRKNVEILRNKTGQQP